MLRPMGWFRSNSAKFAWLAFFALACQFALTFGHLHLSNFDVITAAPTISADSANGLTDAQFSPARQTPTFLTQDFCAVCNNINLAGALVLPATPALSPLLSILWDMQWPFVRMELASGEHFHFDARGPPHA